MSLRRGLALSISSSFILTLPTLNGIVDVWLDTSDESTIVKSGSLVDQIINKAGDTSKNFISTGTNRGFYTLNQINGRAAVTGFSRYTSGDTSSFIYMHDRSTAYAIFDVYKITIQGGSDIINSTSNGGNFNGTWTFPFGTYGLRKTIRQANADLTNSINLVDTWTSNNVYSLNNWFFLSDVYYGYQVPGIDYSISINNNAPAITHLESNTSTYASAPQRFAFTMGGGGGTHSVAEKIIVKWPSSTRVQIDADIAAIKLYIQNKYALW